MSQPSASAILQMLQAAQNTGNVQQLQQLVQMYPVLAKFLPALGVQNQPPPEQTRTKFDPARMTLNELYNNIKGSTAGKVWTTAELTDRANAILNQSYRQAHSGLQRLSKSVSDHHFTSHYCVWS